MYYIYLKRKNGSKFIIGANIFLKNLDTETISCIDRDQLLANITRVESLPLDLSEEVYIYKETEEENIDYGQALYSDCKDIFDTENIKKNILNRFSSPECMTVFLEKYIDLAAGKTVDDKIIEEVRRILKLLKDKDNSMFSFLYAYFEVLMEEIIKDYEAYRFAYLANKSIPKKKVKIMTKNIKGKRKIQ